MSPAQVLYEHIRHPWRDERVAAGPVKVTDQHVAIGPVTRFNTRLAILITRVVGSMWCAYAFGLFDLISLPAAIRGGSATIVSWIAQTFLQLVLLSVIMVGQNVQADAADKRSEATYKDAEAILHGLDQHDAHLAAQDRALLAVQDHLEAQDAALQGLVRQVTDALDRLTPQA